MIVFGAELAGGFPSKITSSVGTVFALFVSFEPMDREPCGVTQYSFQGYFCSLVQGLGNIYPRV